MRIERTLVTRGYEMDASGCVPASVLLSFMEHTRWQAMLDAGYAVRTYWGRGVIRAQRVELLGRVRNDEELRIECWVGRVGTSSFDFCHRIVKTADDAPIARAQVTAVNLDTNGRPKPLADGFKTLVVEGERPEVPALEESAPPSAWTREIVVCPSDQDVLQHVNHARYLDFVEDTRALAARSGAFADKALLERPAQRIFLSYEREASVGMVLVAKLWQLGAEAAFGCELRRADGDGELVLGARIGVGSG
jgi:acyl-CoA thioesterase FadM